MGMDINTVIAFGSDLDKLVTGTLRSSQSQPYQELTYNMAAQEPLVLGVIASPIYDDKSRVIGACILINDRTELERLRSELEANNRLVALGEMAAGLAWELSWVMAIWSRSGSVAIPFPPTASPPSSRRRKRRRLLSSGFCNLPGHCSLRRN